MRLLDYVIGLLYPRKCPFCTKIIEEKLLYCSSCAKKLPYIPNQLQPRSFKYVDEAYSVFYYKDEVRDSILRYKFSALSAYSQVYGQFLRKCIDENGISCDIISWVPLSRRRLRHRGYDQAKLLAKECADYFGEECKALLFKVRHNKAQSGLSDASARKTNVKNAYVFKSDTDIRSKTVLLLDDVVTTGSTVSECAKMLKQAGAARVIVLSVAAVFQ